MTVYIGVLLICLDQCLWSYSNETFDTTAACEQSVARVIEKARPAQSVGTCVPVKVGGFT